LSPGEDVSVDTTTAIDPAIVSAVIAAVNNGSMSMADAEAIFQHQHRLLQQQAQAQAQQQQRTRPAVTVAQVMTRNAIDAIPDLDLDGPPLLGPPAVEQREIEYDNKQQPQPQPQPPLHEGKLTVLSAMTDLASSSSAVPGSGDNTTLVASNSKSEVMFECKIRRSPFRAALDADFPHSMAMVLLVQSGVQPQDELSPADLTTLRPPQIKALRYCVRKGQQLLQKPMPASLYEQEKKRVRFLLSASIKEIPVPVLIFILQFLCP